MKNRFGGLSDTFVKLQNAVVFPHAQDNTCGVLNSDGEFCEFSRGVMGPKRASLSPALSPESDIPLLKGNFLYGGWLRAHFGHFLLESTARLWALNELAEDIDGVIFTPFRNGGVGQAQKRYGPFLDILSGSKPVRIVREPTQVENIVVPDPGFGHHARILGSQRYRDYTRAQVAAAIKPEGAERLYVSRSALMDKRGGVVGELLIESIMRANGYEIFHPQRHSIPDQLARYKAARELVCLDGSALHMAAYALQPGARVGMILRRHANLLDGLAKQVELFAGAKVFSIDALQASWVDEAAKRVDFRSMGELDFEKLHKSLVQHGFITDGPSPEYAADPILKTAFAEIHEKNMRRVPVV